MNVLISGGSGMLGKAITDLLLSEGFQVAWLTRHKKPVAQNISQFEWNPDNGFYDPAAFKWCDSIINLAGESIGEIPWNESGKQKILYSRIQSVQTLAKGINEKKETLKSFVGVSGAGFYGSTSLIHKETDPAGTDFPAFVAKKWEEEYNKIAALKPDRFAILRLGVVLSGSGGALPKLAQPIKLGVGTILGNGNQPFNWLHISDAARIFVEALCWNGVYNASSPEKINNKEVTLALSKILGMPIWLPKAPAFVLKIVLGERSDLVLKGNYSDVTKLEATGFKFNYPNFVNAVRDIYPVK